MHLILKGSKNIRLLYFKRFRNKQPYLLHQCRYQDISSATELLRTATVPTINNTLQAMGTLFVLEAFILGAPYVVQMLKKRILPHTKPFLLIGKGK